MENNTEKYFSDSTKELMRSSAGWMRGFAITMIVLLALFVLGLIILSSTPNSQLTASIFPDAPANASEAIGGFMNILLIGMALFIVVYGYAIIKLLAASNNFTAISYKEKKEDIVNVFRNMKVFWMYYGLSLIGLILFFIIAFAKLFMTAQ